MFSAPAWAVCFEGSVAGVNATETENEVSQPTLEFASLVTTDKCIAREVSLGQEGRVMN